MARRSLYKFGRANTSLYGPKTDTTVVHWKYDWIELATTREEESEGPQRASMFKIKSWVKIPDDEYACPIEGVEGDTLVLVDQIQATAAEIANNELAEQARSSSEAPEVKSQTNMALVT